MRDIKRIPPLRKARRVRSRWTAPTGAALCLCLLLAGGAGAAEHRPVDSRELLPGVTARIAADGSLGIVLQDAPVDAPLLATRIQASEVGRRFRATDAAASAPPFLGRAAEGCPGGHRGLSARADDDGDGLVDEDPLDGVDNDGDGLVDEDFAAVSDGMIAVCAGGDDAGRFEYYHWGYARLRGAVLGTVAAGEGARWLLDTGGAPWVDVSLATTVHSVTGRAIPVKVTAFVSRVAPGVDCRTDGRWLGVAVLDDPGEDRTGRAVLDGRRLAVDVGPRPLAVAVCTADSWLQLTRLLTVARRVRDGVADPVTGDRTPWVVAPACPACRDAAAPAFTWRVARDGDLVLSATPAKGRDALPDPDLMQVGDRRLGAPERIDWRPDEGQETGVAWSCATAAGLARGGHATDPYASLDGIRTHGAAGRLTLRFLDPDPAVIRALSGDATDQPPAKALTLVSLDGRRLTAELAQEMESGDTAHAALALMRTGGGIEPTSPARQSQLLRSGRARPQLAPDLLQGGPNPFRDVVALRFRIPTTIGDAFVWDDADERPAGLDLSAPVPWRTGVPRATVKIYSMSGQELMTLYTGDVAGGETTVTWNGTDTFGRSMASGTYFCKLQLDDWSVTRRLVYLR